MKSIELANSLRQKWCRVGYRFNSSAYKNNVDIETLIWESVVAGRYDSDLMWAVLTWLCENSDLLNISRFSRILAKNCPPYFGTLIEIALSNGADSKIKSLINRCKPLQKREVLFDSLATSELLSKREIENALPVFLKYGYYCSHYTIKRDALHNRAYLLSKNKNLSLRAILGATTKADILFTLSQVSETTINQLASTIGFSYQPVYAEVEKLIKNGYLGCKTWGRVKVVSLSKNGFALLGALC